MSIVRPVARPIVEPIALPPMGERARRGTLTAAIRAMFANGEQGAWYDPSDLSTLYEDPEGTIPVTGTGQSVGLMRDKSGCGNHVSQAAASRKPILQQDANGKYCLVGDGFDDILVNTTYVPQGAQTVAQALAYSALGTTQNSYGQAQSTGGLGLNVNSVGVLGLRYGTGSSNEALASTQGGVALNQPYVLTGWSDGVAAVKIAVNAGAGDTASAITPAGPTGLYLFAFYGGAGTPAAANLYGHLTIARKLSADEMVTLKKYLAARAGLSLSL